MVVVATALLASVLIALHLSQTSRPKSRCLKSFREINLFLIVLISTASRVERWVLHTAQEFSLCWLIVLLHQVLSRRRELKLLSAVALDAGLTASKTSNSVVAAAGNSRNLLLLLLALCTTSVIKPQPVVA